MMLEQIPGVLGMLSWPVHERWCSPAKAETFTEFGLDASTPASKLASRALELASKKGNPALVKHGECLKDTVCAVCGCKIVVGEQVALVP